MNLLTPCNTAAYGLIGFKILLYNHCSSRVTMDLSRLQWRDFKSRSDLITLIIINFIHD